MMPPSETAGSAGERAESDDACGPARLPRRPWCTLLLVGLIAAGRRAHAAEAASPSPLTPVPTGQVGIEDDFWLPRFKLWREVALPEVFDKFEKDGALTNLDGVREGVRGKHGGPPWYERWSDQRGYKPCEEVRRNSQMTPAMKIVPVFPTPRRVPVACSGGEHTRASCLPKHSPS